MAYVTKGEAEGHLMLTVHEAAAGRPYTTPTLGAFAVVGQGVRGVSGREHPGARSTRDDVVGDLEAEVASQDVEALTVGGVDVQGRTAGAGDHRHLDQTGLARAVVAAQQHGGRVRARAEPASRPR